MQKYQELIHRAIDHIRSEQSPDGSFVNLSGHSPTDFSHAIPRRTTFFASTILTCLRHVERRTTDIQNRAASFLLSEKSMRWSFNYWARGDGGNATMPYPPYPDDLDDTFAALTALASYNPSIIDGHILSSIAKILTTQEMRAGGPYRTWLVGNDAPAQWQDTDIVVNATIGYFLSLVGVHLPALEHFISEAVRENRLASPYYPGIFHVGYFISRFYKGNGNTDNAAIRGALADIILGHLHKYSAKNITTLELAMTISSLVYIGHREKIAIAMADALARHVEHEGFMPYAFCIDPTRDGRRCYAGSSALTAASARKLSRYTARPNFHLPPRQHRRPPSMNISAASHEQHAPRSAVHCARPRSRRSIKRRMKGSRSAYDFHEAIYRSGIVIPLDIVEQLSLANLYGWMAYDIYDDVLDGDENASSIPCANFFLRALTEIYSTLAVQIPGMAHLFRTTMNRIDDANAWEQKYCCFPAIPSFGDYHTLADRSIGHAMGPLAELLIAGYSADSVEYKNVELFFRHYLIARQIHDDAHDWVEDLLRGRVTSVGTLVLARFKERYSDKEVITLPGALMPELRAFLERGRRRCGKLDNRTRA